MQVAEGIMKNVKGFVKMAEFVKSVFTDDKKKK